MAHGYNGMVLSLACLPLLVVLPCGIADGWRVSLLLAIWMVGAVMRLKGGDRQIETDCLIFGVASVWAMRKNVLGQIVQDMLGGGSWLLIFRFVVPIAVSALALPWATYGKSAVEKGLPGGLSGWNRGHPKAKIFPCQTKHARMFPKRHSFEYSYLQCGFPIIPAGITSEGEAVGGSHDCYLGSWWLRVRAEDYLSRGSGELGFYGKLKMYLREKHVDDSEWSYAYLVTAPRFFGYSFNPVSFWYIYGSGHQLRKMILEVNNTFGERRVYLLDGSSMPTPPQTPDSEASEPELLPLETKSRFTDLWIKDFHVSPFNSRKGSYALKALNPFPNATYDNPWIDNTITLKSSKDHAKLVARLNSTGMALDPDDLGLLGSLRFILSWWWVGLVTFPRIIREAFKIFFQKKLHVWFRPEVLHTSIGRVPTPTEIELYKFFKEYLSFLVEQSQDVFCITFHSAIPGEPIQQIATTDVPGSERVTQELEIRVLTPAFYSRFVHYTYTSEAFDRECIFTDEKNRTLWISRPELLSLLVSGLRTSASENNGIVRRSRLDELRWAVLRRLRCAPAAAAYPVPSPRREEHTMEDIRALPLSEFDRFVRGVDGRSWAGTYRRTVTKLFLAQRFGLGFAEIIGALDVLVRVLLGCIAASQFRKWTVNASSLSILGCLSKAAKDGDWSAFLIWDRVVVGEWWWLVQATISTFACHGYGMMKGYC